MFVVLSVPPRDPAVRPASRPVYTAQVCVACDAVSAAHDATGRPTLWVDGGTAAADALRAAWDAAGGVPGRTLCPGCFLDAAGRS